MSGFWNSEKDVSSLLIERSQNGSCTRKINENDVKQATMQASERKMRACLNRSGCKIISPIGRRYHSDD